MLTAIRFGASKSHAGLTQEAEVQFTGRSRQAESEVAENEALDSFIRKLGSITQDAKVAVGTPLIDPYIREVLKIDGAVPQVGPRTVSQHMVLGFNKQVRLPIPFRLGNGHLTMNEALRKEQPYLFNNALKAAKEDKLNGKDPLGFTPLHAAVYLNKLPQAKAILAKGADPFVEDANGRSVLEYLARIGQPEALDALLDKASRSIMDNAANQKTAQALQKFARKSHSYIERTTEQCRRLSLDEKKQLMRRLLAQPRNMPEQQFRKSLIAIALVKSGLDTNSDLDAYTREILDYSAVHKNELSLEMTYALLSLNPRLSVDRHQGNNTFLHYVAQKGEPSITRLVLNAGGNVRQTNQDGDTPFHLAVQSVDNDMVQLILRMEPETNQPNRFGQTPLHMLAYSQAEFGRSDSALAEDDEDYYSFLEGDDQTDICKALLRNGADIHQADHAGLSPLRIAETNKIKNLVRILKSYNQT